MATHSSVLAWRSRWTGDPGGPWSLGSQRVRHDGSDWARKQADKESWGKGGISCIQMYVIFCSLCSHYDKISLSDNKYSSALRPWHFWSKLNKDKGPTSPQENGAGMKVREDYPKSTRPLRYDVTQLPYNHTVEVTDRFNRLDLIGRVSEELWWEVCDIVQEAGIKTIPKEKKCKKTEWFSDETLQIAVKRKEVKSKGEKARYTHFNTEFQRIARKDKKVFLSDQWKDIEENNRKEI